MKYPLENLTDTEFQDLVALICEQILGMGTIVFSVGKDGGKDAKFSGKANNYPSKTEPWNGKIIIQAKHTQRYGASCSDSDFKSILKKEVIPKISKLVKNNEIDFYLLFTNRKLSGIQDKRIEDIFGKANIENRLIGLERIQLWLKEYSNIAKALKLNKLLMPLDFNENDLKKIILSFSKIGLKKGNLSEIPKSRNIEKKNDVNKLSKDYFNYVIKKSLTYFSQIKEFLENPINENCLNGYQNTIGDINEEIIIYRDDYNQFEELINHLYKLILNNAPDLENKRSLIRLFLHYMYYNCDIGKSE